MNIVHNFKQLSCNGFARVANTVHLKVRITRLIIVVQVNSETFASRTGSYIIDNGVLRKPNTVKYKRNETLASLGLLFGVKEDQQIM